MRIKEAEVVVNKNEVWQEVISIIEYHHRFVLTSHVNPDCDALGSELALAEHLENLGKRAAIINSDSVSNSYRFLDPRRRIKRYTPKRHAALINEAEIIVVLGCLGELGAGGAGWAGAGSNQCHLGLYRSPILRPVILSIWPSSTPKLPRPGNWSMISSRAMSGSISKRMAQALYAAIVTDTGSFRFPKTSPRTHRITANLLAAGGRSALYLPTTL